MSEQQQHAFLLSPSDWLGEGKIQLSMVEEELPFHTRWTATKKNPSGLIECLQEIQIKGLSDVMQNQFALFDFTVNNFLIELENLTLGKVTGKGIIKDKLIAWEFRAADIGFEGYEFYEKQSDGTYIMCGEYATSDQLRTTIKGKIWRKNLS